MKHSVENLPTDVHSPPPRTIFLLISLALIASSIRTPGQSPAASPSSPRPSFEVASVRMVAPYTEDEIQRGLGNSPWSTFPANRFTAHRLTLKLLIGLAYGVDQRYIQGDPGWVDSQHYDIEAKVEGDQQLTYDQMKPLLQHLLEQRLSLATHLKPSSTSGFALVIAKGGPKLEPSKKDDRASGYIIPNGIQTHGSDLKSFASMLSHPIGSPIVDKTGLAGTFNIKLSYATANDSNSNLPDIFTAVQEQLGLKLEPQKVPVDFLVVDHVERTPTEN